MKSLLRVLGYLKPYKTSVLLTLGFAVLTTLLDLIPPWLIKIVVDRLVDNAAGTTVYWAVLGLAAVYFGRNYANYTRIIFNNRVEQKVVFDLRSEVYRALRRTISVLEPRASTTYQRFDS